MKRSMPPNVSPNATILLRKSQLLPMFEEFFMYSNLFNFLIFSWICMHFKKKSRTSLFYFSTKFMWIWGKKIKVELGFHRSKTILRFPFSFLKCVLWIVGKTWGLIWIQKNPKERKIMPSSTFFLVMLRSHHASTDKF